jgi:hypothetical protein
LEQTASTAMGNAAATPTTAEPKTLTFTAYHGTSWENARHIDRQGFKPSGSGLLGPGVYVVGEQDKAKAERFAKNSQRHGGTDGVLIKSEVTVSNPKYLKGGNAGAGAYAGHDAIRTGHTTMSPNPEWVIRNAKNVKPVWMEKVSGSKTPKCRTPGCKYAANDNPSYFNQKAAVNHGYCCEACRIGHPCGHGGWCVRKCYEC